MTPVEATTGLWVAWLISWMLAALWTRRTQARPPLGEILLYVFPTVAGGLLLFMGANDVLTAHGWAAAYRLWRLQQWAAWLMTSLAAAGFAFTWWARITLGDLWSSQVSRKENHVIVETGPYGLVRHPIYTGLIAAACATAIEIASAQALVGAALMSFGFWMKARLEERFLRQQLGAEAYDAYARRVAMLVPFIA